MLLEVTAGPAWMTTPGPGSSLMWMPMAPPGPGRLLGWHPQPLPCPARAVSAWCHGVRMGGVATASARPPLASRAFHQLDSWADDRAGRHGDRDRRLRHADVQRPHGPAHGAQHALAVAAAHGRTGHPGLRALPARGGGGRVQTRHCCADPAQPALRVLPARWSPCRLFIASLYGLYFTPLFDAAMRTLVGPRLDAAALPGRRAAAVLADHGDRPQPAPQLASPAHPRAVPGDAVPRLLRHRGDDEQHPARQLVRAIPVRLVDQPPERPAVGGGIAWAFSEIPTLLVVAAVFVQWARSSERAGRRHDRAADRDGGEQLAAYNGWLAELTAREGKLR